MIPYTLGNTFVSLVIGGRPFNINSDDARFTKVKELIKARDWDGLILAVDLPRVIERFSIGNIKVYAGTVTYKGTVVANPIVGRILEFARENYPFEPLARFLDKLMENPSEHSRAQLYNYIELYKLPITEDGSFLAVKSVRENLTDHHTGTIDNSPGKVIEMDRAKCNENPNVACAPSYHAGAVDYVKSFGSGRTLLVKINPRDVVSCPTDHSYMKLRFCRYEVLSEVESNNSNTKPFESNLASRNSYYTPSKSEVIARGEAIHEGDQDLLDSAGEAVEELLEEASAALAASHEALDDFSKSRPTAGFMSPRLTNGRFGYGNAGRVGSKRGKNGQFIKAKKPAKPAKKSAKRKKR